MKRMDRMEIAELIERFIQAAQHFEHATVKEANRDISIGNRVTKELEKRGAEQALLALLDHPSPIVRQWAASDALKFAPETAVRVLEDLAENAYGTPGVHATARLMMWKDEKNRAR